MAKPLQVRDGKPLPDPDKVKWVNVSEVQVFKKVLSSEDKLFLDAALKHVSIHGMNAEAISLLDHHFT
jgi:hypothetical protein